MKNPIVVALDLDDPVAAGKLARGLAPHVGGFKIGPRLTLRADHGFIRELSQMGVLFVDHKFFDIPSTTLAAVETAAHLGAHWVTVHALNGRLCLKELAGLEKQIRINRPDFKVLVVTVLTSFSEANLPSIWRQEPVSASVERLATEASLSGLHSFVCSSEEISKLKKLYPDSFLVVPGIRPAGSAVGDQVRVATPQAALKAGASALVIGRPIIGEKDPVSAARQIAESLQ